MTDDRHWNVPELRGRCGVVHSPDDWRRCVLRQHTDAVPHCFGVPAGWEFSQEHLHMEAILVSFATRFRDKFKAGARKHGNDLRDKSALELVGDAIDEAIDQVAYLYTLRDKLAEAEQTRYVEMDE